MELRVQAKPRAFATAEPEVLNRERSPRSHCPPVTEASRSHESGKIARKEWVIMTMCLKTMMSRDDDG